MFSGRHSELIDFLGLYLLPLSCMAPIAAAQAEQTQRPGSQTIVRLPYGVNAAVGTAIVTAKTLASSFSFLLSPRPRLSTACSTAPVLIPERVSPTSHSARAGCIQSVRASPASQSAPSGGGSGFGAAAHQDRAGGLQ